MSELLDPSGQPVTADAPPPAAPEDACPDWWQDITPESLIPINGHFFKPHTIAKNGLILRYVGPTARKRIKPHLVVPQQNQEPTKEP
jgi:hypothetical protein